MEFPEARDLKLLERPRPQKDPAKKYLPYYVSQPREVPRLAGFGEGFRFNVTGLIHDTDGFPTNSPEKTEALLSRLQEKIDSRLEEICLVETEEMEDATIVLCSYGASARSSACAVKEARKMGIKVGLLTLKTLWPFGDFIFERLHPRVKTMIVCEMNLGQIVREVERASRGRFKVIGINISRGTMITPQEIIKKIEGLSRS